MSCTGAPISVALLRELLALNEATGELTWKPREAQHFGPTAKQTAQHKAKNWNNRLAGTPALAYLDLRHGYLKGCIFDRHVSAHRVVFALVHDRWPDGEVDHINGDRRDNRPSNLRDVSHSENLRNMKQLRNNTSGTTGVIFDRTHCKWVARINVNGRCHHIGCYQQKDDAVAARLAANAKHMFHENHGRKAA